MTHLCINCNAPTVQRAGDSFVCAKCKYTWDVAHEQANAPYLATQGRSPALSMVESVQTLDAALGLNRNPVVLLREPQPTGRGPLDERLGEIEPQPTGEMSDTLDAALGLYQSPVLPRTTEARAQIEAILGNKTVSELEAAAEDAGVDLTDARLKADKVAALIDSGRVSLSDDQQTVIVREA